jgi:hypothetical protein
MPNDSYPYIHMHEILYGPQSLFPNFLTHLFKNGLLVLNYRSGIL